MTSRTRVGFCRLAFLAIVSLGLTYARGEAAPASSVTVSTATATPSSSTPEVEIPAAVRQLLEQYAKAFEQEDAAAFKRCFWDPAPYEGFFHEVCRDWFDIHVRFLELKAYAGSSPNQLGLQGTLQSRLRENRTKRLVPLESAARYLLERRNGQWRIVSIAAAAQRSESGK